MSEDTSKKPAEGHSDDPSRNTGVGSDPGEGIRFARVLPSAGVLRIPPGDGAPTGPVGEIPAS